MDADRPRGSVAACPSCGHGFCLEHLIEHDSRCKGRPRSTAVRSPEGAIQWSTLETAPPCAVCAGELAPFGKPLELVLGCIGYFGFGGGYAKAVGHEGGAGPFYCDGCTLRADCWERHRRRTRGIAPAVVDAFERFVAKHGPGPETVARFVRAQVAEGVEAPVEPYSAVLAGNVEDGMGVALLGEPRRRVLPDGRDVSVPWPFPKAAEGRM